MKKILIATTALVATAGVAAAEVSISGYARFGVQYTEGTAAVAAVGATAAQTTAVTTTANAFGAAADAVATAGNTATPAQVNALADAEADYAAAVAAVAAANTGTAAVDDNTGIVSRLRLQMQASTTTDSGIGLNFRKRFQTEENSDTDAAGSAAGNGARFGLTYAGLTIQAGNICGVIECMPNLYMSTNSAGVGLEGHGFSNLAVSNYTAYSSAGAGATDGVEVIYSANGLGLHVHATDDGAAFGASYAISNITLAAAREDFDAGGDTTVVTAGLDLGNGSIALAWGDDSGTTKTVIHGGYDMAPGANLHAFIADEDAGQSYGVGVNYSLGGGASFDAGVTNNAAGRTMLSAGMFFSF